MVVLVVISGNELILGMSLIKMLKRIGPSIDPWGTPHKFEWFYLFLLSVSYHANNLRTTRRLYLIKSVYLVTNHDLHYRGFGKIEKAK